MQFEFPELALLGFPLWLAFRRWGRTRGATGVLRVALLAVLLLALTGPRLDVGGHGVDVVVIADRSLSVSESAQSNIRELINNLQEHVATHPASGNRLSLVTFGGESRVEYELSDRMTQTEFSKPVNPNGSDLHEAILLALDRVSADRPARLLVLSDGESNGADPESAARRARELRVPIDTRTFERLHVGDVSIESVLLPESVVPREPFQYSVWVYSDRDVDASVEVFRDGVSMTNKEQSLASGMNRILFRDLLDEPGIHSYSVKLVVPDDPLLQNNTGAGIVRVETGPGVLVLNSDGRRGNLVRALEAARIPVIAVKAETHPLTQDSLDQYRAVIVENVPADSLGRLKMERLAQYVEDLGGGLLMTGGMRSFGVGGYFKSPLEEILPVSMELREEHRKMRVAMVIALDRSGSMSAPVKGGKTKMDLANLGTAECVRMLAPQDMVAVIAVDSSPHVVQPLTNCDHPESIAKKTLGIQSTGGGIFVYEALVAAGQELMKAEGYSTRHIILFSDAADSEEPGAYKSLLSKFAASGITVSVIGLGTKADSDAALLEDIAKLGSGNCMFTSDAQELPRLFTQDTMSIARNTFIEKDPETQPQGIPGTLLPDARLMGGFPIEVMPTAGGYNLSYLRPEATMAAVSQDEYAAPWSAFWYRGLGRVSAVSLEVDGEFSGAFGQWDSYEDFLITHVRWLLGGADPDDVFVSVEQSGQDAIVNVELDPQRPDQDGSKPPTLIVVPPGEERSLVTEPDFVWTGPHSLQARFRMDQTGSWRTLVKTGSREFKRGPAVTLPYSPEFAPRIGLPDGRSVLARLSELTQGEARTDVLSVFQNPPRSSRTVSLLIPLVLAGIVLLVLEIAGRRLALWDWLATVLSRDRSPVAVAPVGGPVGVSPTAAPNWVSRVKTTFGSRSRRTVATSPNATESAQPAAAPAQFSRTEQSSRSEDSAGRPAPPAGSTPESSTSMQSALEQARQRAKRRMD